MKVFYIRCSSQTQNEARQIEDSKKVNADKVFMEKISGKDSNRPQLKAMLDYVREGDIVYCSELSRLGRNTRDLLNIIEELNKKGVQFVSLKENIDTTTPAGTLILNIFASLSQFEREIILERQRDGIAEAKKQHKYKGRQPIKLDETLFNKMVDEWVKGERTAKSIYEFFNISSQTFYKRINERGIKKIK